MINQTKIEDEGVYKCVVTTNNGHQVETAARLKVESKQEIKTLG